MTAFISGFLYASGCVVLMSAYAFGLTGLADKAEQRYGEWAGYTVMFGGLLLSAGVVGGIVFVAKAAGQ